MKWNKNYFIYNHLGSKAVEVDSAGNIIDYVQYSPFGEPLKKYNYQPQWNERLGYIDKEKDRESKLGDHGVRKYDYEIGRFTSVDPLFEKFHGWSPNNYSFNNPINLVDRNGKNPGAALVIPAYVGGAVVIGVIGWAYNEATNPGSTQSLIETISTSFNNAKNDVHNIIYQVSADEKPKEGVNDENTNPYAGPVSKPVTVVDDKGNAIPVKEGEHIQGSSDGQFEQVYKGKKPTGIRKDGPHGSNHKPEGQRPHAHRPDIPGTNHWLEIKR